MSNLSQLRLLIENPMKSFSYGDLRFRPIFIGHRGMVLITGSSKKGCHKHHNKSTIYIIQ